MFVYHYPGLERINERNNHWELNIPIKQVRKIYPLLGKKWEIESIPNYIINRDHLARKLGIKSFLHLWYFDGSNPVWDETLKYICNQKNSLTPVSLVWCWKRPPLAPLLECLPHLITLRDSQRELIQNERDLVNGISYIAANYIKSKNYYLETLRPLIFFYHLEGWLEIFKHKHELFGFIRDQFNKFDFNPYLVGISVSPVSKMSVESYKGLDGVARYNDLPDFFGIDYQNFKLRTLEYTSDWPRVMEMLKSHDLDFIPSVSLGWNATLRFFGLKTKENRGYPLTPIVESPTLDDFKWCLDFTQNKVEKLNVKMYSICAWNEWTENASMEYYYSLPGVLAY